MIDKPSSGIPLKYKQSKLKPLRAMIYVGLSILLPLALMLLGYFVPTEETAENPTILPLIIVFAVVLAVASVAAFIISYCIWKSDGFTIADDGISYDLTFIIKRFVKLPYDKINIVKIKRNIFDIILGISAVKIGSGSGLTSGIAEITLIFDKKYAEYFVDYIQKRAAAAKENRILDEDFIPPDKTVSAPKEALLSDSDCFTSGDKLRMIFTHDAFYFLIAVFVAVVCVLVYFKDIISEGTAVNYVYFVVYTIIALIVIVFIAVLATFIRYYDFKIYQKDGCIHFSYGLVSKQSFSVSRNKIRGYSISQGLFGQLFKTGKLRLVVVGMSEISGNNNQTITYLYPCAGLKRLNEIVEKFLPEFKYDDSVQKAGKYAILHNFIIPAFWTSLILMPFLAIPAILFNPLILLVLPGLLLLMLFYSIMLKRNTAFGVSNKFSYAKTGGFYKRTIILRTDAIQEINSYAGFIRRRQGIRTYHIAFRGDSLITTRIAVRNLPLISLDKFE